MPETAPMSGVLAPVLTPFRSDLSADPDRLVRHCRWLLSQDCGLAVFGTNSEGNSLAVDEKIALIDALVEAGLDPARMMPGTGHCAIPDTVRLTAHAVSRGCGGVLMLPPFYYKGVSEDGLFRAFAEVVERVGDARLRVYLYHIPQIAQVGISLGLIERLLKAYPTVIAGIKDSSGDWANIKAMLDAFPGWGVFAGNEARLVDVMRHGGKGCISATCNVNPAAIARLAAEWRAADSEVRQRACNAVRDTIAGHPMIPALKFLVGRMHGDSEWRRLRPPLTELPTGAGERLLTALEAQDIAIPTIH